MYRITVLSEWILLCGKAVFWIPAMIRGSAVWCKCATAHIIMYVTPYNCL